jgi:hypothetical protein
MLAFFRLYRYIALFLLKLFKTGRATAVILPHCKTSHSQQI